MYSSSSSSSCSSIYENLYFHRTHASCPFIQADTLVQSTYLKNKHLLIEEKILRSHVITKNVLKYRGAIIPKSKMKI